VGVSDDDAVMAPDYHDLKLHGAAEQGGVVMDKYIAYLEKRIKELEKLYRHYTEKNDYGFASSAWSRLDEMKKMHFYFTKGAGREE